MKSQPRRKHSIIDELRRRWRRRREGEQIILRRYQEIYGRLPNLRHPKLFSEKLYRQMIETNNDVPALMTKLSDKLRVRDWVKSKVGGDILVPLLWHGSTPTRIPFDQLPKKYILKVNHGSGGNIIVDGRPRSREIIDRLSNWLQTNYYWEDREAQYLHIRPRVLTEALLEGEGGPHEGPLDYRFWCFNGKPALIQVDDISHSVNPFYDVDWKKLDLTYRTNFNQYDSEKPIQLASMLDIAATLSYGFPFVRVDLYCVAGRVYFGEMTFTPVAGRLRFSPTEWDERLGALWIDYP